MTRKILALMAVAILATGTAWAGKTPVMRLDASPWTCADIIQFTGTIAIVNSLAIGSDGTDGEVVIYSEQGGTDYVVRLRPHATMTANMILYLPAALPGATAFLTCTTGGQLGFDTSTYLTSEADTLATILGRGSSSSILMTLTGGLTLGADDDTSNLILHSGSMIQVFDDSDDTSVTIGPVGDGTTVLGVTGTINATGLQVGGVAVLTAEADTLATVTTRGATTTTAVVISAASALELGKDDATNTAGYIKLWSAGAVDFYTTITTATQDANAAYTLPVNDGDASQVLTTNGSGTLSWTTLAGGGIANVVEDTTPQLGGDLDPNGHAITGYLDDEHSITTATSSIVTGTDDQKIVVANASAAPDANVKLLLHANASPFTDEKSHTVTTASVTLAGSYPTLTDNVDAGSFNGGSSDWHLDDSNDWWMAGSDFTLSMWIYVPSGGHSGSRTLMTQGDTGGAYYSWYLDSSASGDGKLRFYNDQLGVDLSASDATPVDEWVFVAVTRYGDVWSLYRNTTRVDTETTSGIISNYGGRLGIGCMYYWDNSRASFFSGYIDEVYLNIGEAKFTGASCVVPTDQWSIYGAAVKTYDYCPTKVTDLVVGPASVTDGVPALFDGTTGKLIKAGTAAVLAAGTTNLTGDWDTGNYAVRSLTKATAHTGTGDITAVECRNGITTNVGAGGAIVLTLPDAVAGMCVIVYVVAAYDVDVNPYGSEQILILTDAAGDAISSDATPGSFICLYAISATEWIPLGTVGTWTDAN